MKKILLSLITVLSLIIALPVSAKDEPVTVYMFSKDGCSACIQAEEYFDGLLEEHPGLFEVKEIVVFDGEFQPVNEDRTNLLIKVYEKFGEDTSTAATPTIVIGDYHTVGLPQDTSAVYDAIVDAKDDKKVDVVEEFIDELDLDLEELLKYESSTAVTPEDSTGGKYDALIVAGIFVVLIGGFAALVFLGKK